MYGPVPPLPYTVTIVGMHPDLRARIAQLVERFHGKEKVPGSIPGVGLVGGCVISFLDMTEPRSSHFCPLGVCGGTPPS